MPRVEHREQRGEVLRPHAVKPGVSEVEGDRCAFETAPHLSLKGALATTPDARERQRVRGHRRVPIGLKMPDHLVRHAGGGAGLLARTASSISRNHMPICHRNEQPCAFVVNNKFHGDAEPRALRARPAGRNASAEKAERWAGGNERKLNWVPVARKITPNRETSEQTQTTTQTKALTPV